jgi:hypothetical protein
MIRRISAAALVVALVTSSAAIAAPRDYSLATLDTPGAFFTCFSPHGPALRTGPCWLDAVRAHGG